MQIPVPTDCHFKILLRWVSCVLIISLSRGPAKNSSPSLTKDKLQHHYILEEDDQVLGPSGELDMKPSC